MTSFERIGLEHIKNYVDIHTIRFVFRISLLIRRGWESNRIKIDSNSSQSSKLIRGV